MNRPWYVSKEFIKLMRTVFVGFVIGFFYSILISAILYGSVNVLLMMITGFGAMLTCAFPLIEIKSADYAKVKE